MFKKAYLTKDANYIDFILIGLFGAALTIVSTSFLRFDSNNIYHLPIVSRLYDLPQFQNDSYIQSLRWFSSGFWQSIAGSESWLSADILFPILLYISRLTVVLSILHFSVTFGYQSVGHLLLLSVIVAFNSLLLGTAVGGGGLFWTTFAQSEFANGTLLFAISYTLRKQFGRSVAFVGATAFLNLFMAIWVSIPIFLVFIYFVRGNQIKLWRALPRILPGFMLSILFCIPVIQNILKNPDFGQYASFSYRHFLYQYWPYHFFPDKVRWDEYIRVSLVLATSIVALNILVQKDQQFRNAVTLTIVGFSIVFGVGICLPFMTDSRLLLNLHLIRSAVDFWLLAAVFTSILTTSMILSHGYVERRVFGPLAAVFFCSFKVFLVPGLLLLLAYWNSSARAFGADRLMPSLLIKRPWLRLDVVALVFLVGGYWPIMSVTRASAAREAGNATEEWKAIADWASANTSPDALFLIPTFDIRPDVSVAVLSYDKSMRKAIEGSIVFEFFSHRRIWVDFKRGAAVMWSPSYYDEWNRRILEVLALRTTAEKLEYARTHDISYVVEPCEETRASQSIFRTERFCVYLAQSGAL